MKSRKDNVGFRLANLESLVLMLRDACNAAMLSVNLDLGLVDISRVPQSEAKRLIELRDTLSLAIAAVEQSGDEVASKISDAEAVKAQAARIRDLVSDLERERRQFSDLYERFKIARNALQVIAEYAWKNPAGDDYRILREHIDNAKKLFQA